MEIKIEKKCIIYRSFVAVAAVAVFVFALLMFIGYAGLEGAGAGPVMLWIGVAIAALGIAAYYVLRIFENNTIAAFGILATGAIAFILVLVGFIIVAGDAGWDFWGNWINLLVFGFAPLAFGIRGFLYHRCPKTPNAEA